MRVGLEESANLLPNTGGAFPDTGGGDLWGRLPDGLAAEQVLVDKLLIAGRQGVEEIGHVGVGVGRSRFALSPFSRSAFPSLASELASEMARSHILGDAAQKGA